MSASTSAGAKWSPDKHSNPSLSITNSCIIPARVTISSSNTVYTLVSGKVWLVEKFARGHPQKWCQMRGVWVFFDDFQPICRHISKTVHFRHKVTMDGNREPYAGYRMVSLSMTLSDPCHFRWPWVTPDPVFKVTVVLKGEYLQSDAFYR